MTSSAFPQVQALQGATAFYPAVREEPMMAYARACVPLQSRERNRRRPERKTLLKLIGTLLDD
jgi:hypothetical protein